MSLCCNIHNRSIHEQKENHEKSTPFIGSSYSFPCCQIWRNLSTWASWFPGRKWEQVHKEDSVADGKRHFACAQLQSHISKCLPFLTALPKNERCSQRWWSFLLCLISSGNLVAWRFSPEIQAIWDRSCFFDISSETTQEN